MNYRLAVVIVLVGLAASSFADDGSEPRARPPEWPRDVLDVFFDDARQQLVGSRPNYEAAATGGTHVASADSAGPPAATQTQYTWSKLVDADVLESEIKRQLAPLEPLVATPSAFKGGGYRECRNRFTWLATLFSIVAAHDQPVGWQDSADGLAQLFARVGFNCKVGTDQSFRESQLRVEDLADLVRGGRPDVPNPQPDVGWDRRADRTPLMRQMEKSLGERISPNASDARAMWSNADELRHEAQLLAMLAEVIAQPGFDYADEETYLATANQLRDASAALAQAVDVDDFDAARRAMGSMEKACSNCHDEWR